MRVVAILVSAILFYLIPDAVLETIFSTGFTACRNISQYIFNADELEDRSQIEKSVQRLRDLLKL